MNRQNLIDMVIKRFSISRTEAQGLIMAGKVLVNDQPVTKSGTRLKNDVEIRIKQSNRYVSRGAYKLLTALKQFNISILDYNCMDVGSSTGGFTQVLLEAGAQSVISVDCGTNQLDYSLRSDKRVTVYEGHRIQDITPQLIGRKPDIVVIDVSFCSLLAPLAHCYKILGLTRFIALAKPQFEYVRLAEKLHLPDNFNGIITEERIRSLILEELQKEILGIGLTVKEQVASDIEGSRGNLEYLLHITATTEPI